MNLEQNWKYGFNSFYDFGGMVQTLMESKVLEFKQSCKSQNPNR